MFGWVININMTNGEQMDIMCLQMWYPEDTTSPVQYYSQGNIILIWPWLKETPDKHNVRDVLFKDGGRTIYVNVTKDKEKLWKCFTLKEASKETWPLSVTSDPGLDPLLGEKML